MTNNSMHAEIASKREVLIQQLKESKDLKETAELLNAIKVIEEIIKVDADKRKAETDITSIRYQNKPSLWKKFNLVAPVITSLGLIITLYLSFYSTNSNIAIQQKNKEDEKYKVLMEKIGLPNWTNNEILPTMLKEFFNSDTYRNNAVQISTNYLSKVDSAEIFKDFFRDYIKAINGDNYSYLVQLTRNLNDRFVRADERLRIERKNIDSLKNLRLVNRSFQNEYLKIAGDSIVLQEIEQRINLSSNGLGKIVMNLLKHNPESNSKKGVSMDLTDANFNQVNLDSVDLTNSTIRNANFSNVSFRDANLSGIKDFDASSWSDSAWWLAKDIDGALLNYLITYFPYIPSESYFGSQDSKENAMRYKVWLKRNKKFTGYNKPSK